MNHRSLTDRHAKLRARPGGSDESDTTTTKTLSSSARRRLHYMNFGRLEQFLSQRLREAEERQRQQLQLQKQQRAEESNLAIPSPLTAEQGTAKPTPRPSSAAIATPTPSRSASVRPPSWIQRANRARRRLAHRLSSVVAGCLRGERVDEKLEIQSRADNSQNGIEEGDGLTGDEMPLQPISLSSISEMRAARSLHQRCNNASGMSDQGSATRSSRAKEGATRNSTDRPPASKREAMPEASEPIDAIEKAEATAEVHQRSTVRTPRLRSSANSSRSGSARSYATTLTAVTANQPASVPPSSSPSAALEATPSPTVSSRSRRYERSQPHPIQQRSHSVKDDRRALLLTSARDTAQEIEEPQQDQVANLNAADSTAKAQNITKQSPTAARPGGPNRRIVSRGEKSANNAADGAGKTRLIGGAGFASGGAFRILKQQAKKMPMKKMAKTGRPNASKSGSTAVDDKLFTVTSEGVAWSDELESLANAPMEKLHRRGAAERKVAEPLQEDPLYDPPRSVTLRRIVECPLMPLMTYKTDKKGELFYSVVQVCQTCRKDVCPKCRRSLCAFCTAITCPDCRMLLHQMVEISRVDGGGRNRCRQQRSDVTAAGQLVRAGPSQQQQHLSQPYCHSCEKPLCLICVDNLSMLLPTNERCVQHSASGNAYENICPWCGRTVCRECRRSSCFACTKAFQCACQSNCQCDTKQLQ